MASETDEQAKSNSSLYDGINDSEQYVFQFDDEKYKLGDFEDEKNLPTVVRFEDTQGDVTPGIKIYAETPVLFFTRRSQKQASVRTIYRDNSGAFFEVGQTLIIPEDYQGWFEVVPSDFTRASCYKSIAELAESMPRKFFTRSNIKAIRVITNENGEEQYLERKIPAGSILKTDSIFTAKWKTEAETGLFKKKSSQWTTYEVKYLNCITTTDQKEILIPLTTKGKFNAVYERGKLDCNSVYTMKDILSDLSLPVRVRLLFGKAPVVPCIFTGMLNVRSFKTEQKIIASTVLNKRNVLFEVPIGLGCSVQVSNNLEECCDLDTYRDGVKLCQKYAHMYSTMIKLSPKMDTNSQVMQHIPTDPSYMKTVDDALKALDLITDISLTEEPKDHLMESSSDTDSLRSDQPTIPRGTLMNLTRDTSQSTA
ncbi:hypothetical protein LOTGIDRAFT_237593 [Lottia gigantea]|uniref:CABIT domain-containing protein n=1 Tax=Lottia gigantea TaxID=225164 RepID=V4B7K5_LOTGI|nr:hypothetical protein LOTGIDRAFT_237593 [Lottia gigantea]ESP03586.1 hypothetical protein LOTGIDRAFT_237593 [Lottia gigantea]